MDPGPGPGALLLAGMGDVPAHASTAGSRRGLKLSGGKLHGKRRVDALEAPTTSARVAHEWGSARPPRIQRRRVEPNRMPRESEGRLLDPGGDQHLHVDLQETRPGQTPLARELPNKTKKQIANFTTTPRRSWGWTTLAARQGAEARQAQREETGAQAGHEGQLPASHRPPQIMDRGGYKHLCVRLSGEGARLDAGAAPAR